MWHFSEFDGISKNGKHWAICNFWCRMTIPMLDTLLKSSKCIFFEKLFWVPFGVPRLTVKSHLYASSIYFLFKNWNEFSDFKYSMGTIVVPKKFVLPTLKSKPQHSISPMKLWSVCKILLHFEVWCFCLISKDRPVFI